MKPCYFQGCSRAGATMEHIPPKAFFPKDQRDQLFTVPSCKAHNNDKSPDDLYVLAHICLNASPKNRAREIFRERVLPQLEYNENALRKALLRDAVPLGNGAVKYRVNRERFDRFFSALSFGIVYKASQENLQSDYVAGHIYPDFLDEEEPEEERKLIEGIFTFYAREKPLDVLDFGQVKTKNTTIYSAKIFGIPGFRSSITVAHEFFGAFRVISMLTKKPPARVSGGAVRVP
jgi:hypothetical protein